MISIRGMIDYDIPGLFASERDRREVLRAAWADTGEHWHRQFLPPHFRRGADTRYGYNQRDPKYLKRKQQLAARGAAIEGGQTPLVLTGLMRRQMTQTAVVRGFLSRFQVQMEVPRYAQIHKRLSAKAGPRRQNAARTLAAEAQILREDELVKLANYLAARITHHNNRVRRRRRVTIR